MTASPRTLTQMQNYPTSYEVAVTANGTTTHLGFTERTTKIALLRMSQAHGEFIITLLGDWKGNWVYTKASGVTFGPVRVHFTGKSEREIASEMGRI